MAKTASVLDNYPDYELTIGIEVHAQLTTKAKFSAHVPTALPRNPTEIFVLFVPANLVCSLF